MKESKNFYDTLKKLIYSILQKERVLESEWHLGVVTQVINSQTLMVVVDGYGQPQKIPCNPDVPFASGNLVYVLQRAKNPLNKFVAFRVRPS